MVYKFCLVPYSEWKKGVAIGRAWADEHESEWIEYNPEPYLAAGYVKGVDHVTKDGISYQIMKTYIDLDNNYILHVCAESVQACDVKKVVKEETISVEDENQNLENDENKEPENSEVIEDEGTTNSESDEKTDGE